MRPQTLVRIGSSYFIEEDEISRLTEVYFNQQIVLRKKRAAQSRKNFAKKRIRRSSNSAEV